MILVESNMPGITVLETVNHRTAIELVEKLKDWVQVKQVNMTYEVIDFNEVTNAGNVLNANKSYSILVTLEPSQIRNIVGDYVNTERICY